MERERLARLRSFAKRLGWPFRRWDLLDVALTHRSYTNEAKGSRHNETLEFLGDSVLQLVVNEHLFRSFPEMRENRLSRIKSYVVSKKTLATVAAAAGLGQFLRLGRGELATGGLEKESNLANAFEAVIAALYLDRGLAAVRKHLLPLLEPHIRTILNDEADFDNKSRLQEWVQRRFKSRPIYRLVAVEGPEHERTFRVEVLIEGEVWGRGEGGRKATAEDRAAKDALERIRSDERS